MTMPDDMDLLREYATSNSETAFASLVSRHINLVHAVAMRNVGNPQHAEEITQAVFIILARKARSLRPGTVLSGWLFHTARLTAANFIRGEIRRKQREQEAYMQSTLQETDGDEVWRQVAPLLDKAVAELGEKDRNAVVLRYVEGKDLKEVGAAMGTSESAAQRRLSRAVEKLRKFFTKRGVFLTGTVLAASVSANAAPVAPAGLASSVAAVAALKGATAGASIVALTDGTIKLMAWAKVKFAMGVATACLTLAGGVVALDKLPALSGGPRFADGLTAADIVKKVAEKYDSLTSYEDTGSGSQEGFASPAQWTFSTRLERKNLYRVEVKAGNATSVAWSDGNENFAMPMGGKKYFKADKATRAFGISGAAPYVPVIFFGGASSSLLLHGRPDSEISRGKDEPIAGVDCYVLTRVLPGEDVVADDGDVTPSAGAVDLTAWVGKDDFLIHQWRSVSSVSRQTETHENIVINKPLTKEDFKYEPPPDAVLADHPNVSNGVAP